MPCVRGAVLVEGEVDAVKRLFVFVLGFLMVFATGCAGSGVDSLPAGNADDADAPVSQDVVVDEEEGFLPPPSDEFDSVILEDGSGRYYLCKKVEAGFNANVTMYGIYDSKLAEWTCPFAELPEIPLGRRASQAGIDESDFFDLGEGVFCFWTSSYFGSWLYCLSFDAGGYFSHEIYSPDVFYDFNDSISEFANGEAFLLAPQDSYHTDGYPRYSSSRNNLCLLSTAGELRDVFVEEIEDQDFIEWRGRALSAKGDRQIYATLFYDIKAEDDSDGYLFVYFRDSGNHVLIDDQMYVDRVHYDNSEDKRTLVTLDGDLIRVENLQGDDEQMYYAEFDLEGNLVTEATLM